MLIGRTGLGHVSGDADPERKPNFLYLKSLRSLAPKLVTRFVIKEECGAIRVHDLGRFLHNHLQQLVQSNFSGQRF